MKNFISIVCALALVPCLAHAQADSDGPPPPSDVQAVQPQTPQPNVQPPAPPAAPPPRAQSQVQR
ncbi:MAG TPA: hypothetical protein VGH20_03670, partial [Myxococcales bacterium]